MRHVHCTDIVLALFAATIAILIRSIFRIAELSRGFHGDIWNNEVDYMVLKGGMMAFACLLLTFAHPGIAFRTVLPTVNGFNWKFNQSKRQSNQSNTRSDISQANQIFEPRSDI